MYDYVTINSDILFFFGIGIFALLCGLYRAFFKKDEENRTSWLIGGICMCVFFFGFGISDIVAAKKPDIEIYIGEYVESDSMGTGSTRKTYCFFHAHDGSLKKGFISADIEHFLIPEQGKWYEIRYIKNSSQSAVVSVVEIEPPEHIEYADENQNIEIYIGEFIKKHTYGKGSNESIEYKFDAHDGGNPQWFRDEEIEYFLIPEEGKWYELRYINKNRYKMVVEITETEPPKYYFEDAKEYDDTK